MKITHRSACTVAAAVVLAALATYVWLGFFSRYLADDYGFPVSIRQQGFWASQWDWYRTWSGRFAATFLSSLLALGGTKTPPFVPLTLIAVWLFSLERAAGVLFPTSLRAWRVLFAATFVWACCDAAPDVYQTLLWQTGAVTYVLPLLLLPWLAVALVRTNVIAAVALTFIVCGFAEILALSVTAAAMVTAIFTSGRMRRAALAAVAGAIAGTLLLALAPGNAVRKTHFPNPPPLATEIVQTAEHSLQYAAWFVRRASAPAALLLAITALAGASAPNRRRLAGAWIAAAAAVPIAHFIAVHTGYGHPPARGIVTTDVFLFAAVAFSGMELGRFVTEQRRKLVWVAVIVLLAAGPLCTIVLNSALVSNAHQFARRWDDIDRTLRAAKGQAIVIDAPVSVGGLLFITPYPRHPANRAVAEYYGLASVASR